jgi:hypothetical protein
MVCRENYEAARQRGTADSRWSEQMIDIDAMMNRARRDNLRSSMK